MHVLYFFYASPTLFEGEEGCRELAGGEVHPGRRVQAPPLQIPGCGGNQLSSQGEYNLYPLKKSQNYNEDLYKSKLSVFILKLFYWNDIVRNWVEKGEKESW